MATKKELSKEDRIKREYNRLRRIFKDIGEGKFKTVESLIRNAAFMAVSLDELQEQINAEGYVVEYQNGANQSGTKQSDAVKTHIAMTKNHAAIIKQLCDLVPPEKEERKPLTGVARRMTAPYANYIVEYYDGIKNGRYVVGKWIRLVYEYVVAGLQRGDFFFNAKKANKAIRFIENFCHHCEGRTDLLKLEVWQKAAVSLMFGIVESDGTRVFREVFIVIGRKNGKTLSRPP